MPWSDPDFTVFPNNITQALYDSYLTLPDMDADHIFRRPLRPSDPDWCVGVFPTDWNPREFEIGKGFDPALAQYMLTVHAFVKHADEELGLAAHANLSKRVRTMVYRDMPTRVRLQSLSVTEDGTIERTQRYGVGTQRFMANEAPQGTFLYLSTMSFWLETETVTP